MTAFKKISLLLVVLLLLVSSTGIVTVFADSANVTDSIPNELSVPEGKDYVFYAQTRQNRLDDSKTDVRIICVANLEYITTVSNFVTTLTFDNGSAPKTFSFGLDIVFDQITAYDTDGTVVVYTAADDAVLFGWVITDVPADYASISATNPLVSVSTDPDAEPTVSLDAPNYATIVEANTELDVFDGVYHSCSLKPYEGIVGDITGSGDKATYIVTGNYDGVYEVIVTYCDNDGNRPFSVNVNGVVQSAKSDKTGSWSAPNYHTDGDDVGTLTKTFIFQMKKGANVVTFSGIGGDHAPNLVDIDFVRVDATMKEVITLPVEDGADYMDYDNGGHGVESCRDDASVKKVGWLDAEHYVSFFVDAPVDGTYLLVIDFLTDDGGRKFGVTVDDNDRERVGGYKSGSNDYAKDRGHAAIMLELSGGEHVIRIDGYDYHAPNVLGITLIQVISE